MGMPGWAMALGAPLAVDKLVVDPIEGAYKLYKTIRDGQADSNDKAAGMDMIKRLQADPYAPIDLSAFSDPNAAAITYDRAMKMRDQGQKTKAAPVLSEFAKDYRNAVGTGDFTDPDSLAVLRQQGVDAPTPEDMQNPYVRQGVDALGEEGQRAADAEGAISGKASPASLGWLATAPIAHNLTSIQTNTNKDLDRIAALSKDTLARNDALAKEATVTAGKKNISDFQGAISGLTSPSQSQSGLARFSNRGGYAPIYDVEADIRNAAAAYNVGDSDEVGKAITEARGAYKDTLLPTEAGKVGRTSYTGQRNLLGDFKKDAQSTAPVIKVNIPNPRADRKDEFSLRKEFLGLPEVKEFPTIEANSRRSIAALQATGSKLAVDQSLITVFNKMIDPTSVVRESEYARTPQDQSVLNRIKGKWGKIQEGGAGLSNHHLKEQAKKKNNLTNIPSRQYNDRAEEYRQLANDYGFDIKRIVARRNGLDADKGGNGPTPQQAAAELARRRGKK